MKMMTMKQVADRLNVSENTVRRLSRQRLIPSAVRVGKRLLRWRAEEIEAYASGVAVAGIDLHDAIGATPKQPA
jgi:excisionase family DNA binding protein